MALNLSAADALLKEFYLPGVREQLNNKVMFLSQIEKNTTSVEGREFVLATHIGRNSGVGFRADGGSYPTAGSQQYVDAKGTPKHVYGVFKMTGPTIRAMKSNQGSYLRAIDTEVRGNTNDTKRAVNRALWGTSDGVIATCGTTSASTTVVLAAATSSVQLAQLEVGMVVDIVSFSGGVATPVANGSAVTITAKTPATPSITISGSGVTTSSSDFVVQSGSGGSGTSQVEVTGMQTIAGTTTGAVFGIDPATYPTWVPTVDSNSGTLRSISEPIIEKNMQAVEFASGESVDLLISNYGVQRAVAGLLTAQKRYVNTVDLKAGYKGIEVNAGGVSPAALITERDAPSNQLYGISTSHFFECAQSDWEFAQEDGGNILIRSTTADSYQGVFLKDLELMTDRRNASLCIKDITEG